jgi:4-hydroxymandelate oxidase
MSESAGLTTVRAYEQRARELLPRSMWDSLFGDYGAAGWETCTNNVDAFSRTSLAPHVLVDVSRRSLATTVLGSEISLPVLIAPLGHQQRVHAQGEAATARAAGRAQTLMILSTAASYSIEEVASVATGPLWSQLYFMRDRRVTERLIARAEDSGYRAIVLTVDNPGTTSRERDSPSSWKLEDEPRLASTLEADRVFRNFRGLDLLDFEPITRQTFHGSFDSSLTWADLEWLRERTTLPLVVKGIQRGSDARLCREHGVDGLVVSNHGGFALPNARGTLETLPEVVTECGAVEVYIDGGVRRGTDILKALALGARAVLIGRAQVWGLAVDGEAGVEHVLELLREELYQAMGLCGVVDVRDVDRSLVVPPR